MADIQSPTAEIRRGKKKKKLHHKNICGLPYYIGRPKEETKGQKYNGIP